MLYKLRIRLTIICTISTAVILTIMAASSLYVSVNHLNKRGEISFTSDVNSILYHIEGQKVIDHAWLSQTEKNSQAIVYLEDNKIPLFYRGVSGQGTTFQLVEQAKAEAQKKFQFDLTIPPSTTLQADKVFFTFTTPDGINYYAAAATIPSIHNWIGLIVMRSMEEEEKQIQSLSLVFAGLVLMAVFGLGCFSWIFTGRAIQPIRENQKRQVEFISAASHELRSPLAVIQTSISAMLQAPPEKAKRFSETIIQECSRMSRLISDLLLLAGGDSKHWSVHLQPTNLETLILNTAESYETICKQKGLKIQAVCSDEELPDCCCDKERIMQVLSILLDNAVSYTPSGGSISLEAKKASISTHFSGAEIRVSDTGQGIPDDQKAHVFERFYRGDSSRSKKEHFGLGLSIAQEIVHLHKGKILVKDTPGGGTTFLILLPW